jgi:TetR/AcrR family transcriptional regulator
MTQSYADFAAQMTLVLDRSELTEQDFQEGEQLITAMVLSTLTDRN